jgi:hypothetical protein
LFIEAGVEIEFYPNVGILVLGDLIASGIPQNRIKMRPVRRSMNRSPYFSTPFEQQFEKYEGIIKESSPHIVNIKDKPYLSPSNENFGHFNNFADGDESKYFYESLTRRLRFFEGLTPNEGFLQIYNTTMRSWTMVCDQQFTLASASVVCKQMNKEYRNALVKPLWYYLAPHAQQPVWNQTFLCIGNERSLSECATFANYHLEECAKTSEFTYVMCNDYNLNTTIYEHAWGGIRFAQSFFETEPTRRQNHARRASLVDRDGFSESANSPIFIKSDLQPQPKDNSFMSYVDIVGAGRLHNDRAPAVQITYRTPLLIECTVQDSAYHGVEFLQTQSTLTLSKLHINNSLGYGINSVQLNVQTSDQKSSYSPLKYNTLSTDNIFSMLDICDPHKYYNIDKRVVIYYKYSQIARDCVKIFRTRFTASNMAGTGELGIRFMQVQLINNTVQNDTIELYNGTVFRRHFLMKTLNNGSSSNDFASFYLSGSDTLSIYFKASAGREYYGFIAEVIVYPAAQYLSTDTYIEFSDSIMTNNQLGSLSYVSAGERNPPLYLMRNRYVKNGFQYFNTSTPPSIDVILQNTPKFYFGNSYIGENWGGVSLKFHSGSGVLITSSIVYNNLFYANRNDTTLLTKGELTLPYNELTIDKNIFLENESPRTDIIHVSGVMSKFTRNQILYNKGMRILYTQGFENVSAPRSQEISYNLLRDNYAYGIYNELERSDRFRTTMVAASLKQVYYGNYLFNQYNDFELIALEDPISVSFLNSYLYGSPYSDNPIYGSRTTLPYDWNNNYFVEMERHHVNSQNYHPDMPYREALEKGLLVDPFYNPDIEPNKQQEIPYLSTRPSKINDRKMIGFAAAYSEGINASFNYWHTDVDTRIRGRIRDKYDNLTLYEIIYSPAVLDEVNTFINLF